MSSILHLSPIHWRPLAWLRTLLQRPMRTKRPDTESADVLDALARLDNRVLRDIGAPDGLLARAVARRDDQRLHDDLTLGFGAATWRHW